MREKETMTIEDQVCSLDLAKKMKELGVKQDGAFDWIVPSHYNPFIGVRSAWTDHDLNKKGDFYSAFTVAELGEMLPANHKFTNENHNSPWSILTYKGPSGYYFSTLTQFNQTTEKPLPIEFQCKSGLGPIYFREKTEANARAKMLIYLIEQGIVKP